MNSFIKENQKDRLLFVDKWAEYVRTHSDKEWSKQQNVIINSCLRVCFLEYLMSLSGKSDYNISPNACVRNTRFDSCDAIRVHVGQISSPHQPENCIRP